MKQLYVDGKPVRSYLFARYTRVATSGVIPVDRKQRAGELLRTDQPRYLSLAQVEAFDKDHAYRRLQNELFPSVPKSDWELLEELDPEHDVGKLGSKHPLLPHVMKNPGTTQ